MSDNNYRKFWEHHRVCVYSGEECNNPSEYHFSPDDKWMFLKYKSKIYVGKFLQTTYSRN